MTDEQSRVTDAVDDEGRVTTLRGLVAWLVSLGLDAGAVSEGELAAAFAVDRISVRELAREGQLIGDVLRDQRMARVRHQVDAYHSLTRDPQMRERFGLGSGPGLDERRPPLHAETPGLGGYRARLLFELPGLGAKSTLGQIARLLDETRQRVLYVDDTPPGARALSAERLSAERGSGECLDVPLPPWLPLLAPPELGAVDYAALPVPEKSHCHAQLPPLAYLRSPSVRRAAEAVMYWGLPTVAGNATAATMPLSLAPGACAAAPPLDLVGLRRPRRRPPCACCAWAGVFHGPRRDAAFTFHCPRGCACHG